MALDPGADVGGRMLVAVLILFAERVVQLKRRGQRGKGEQAEPQQRNQRPYEKTCFHQLRKIPV